jgi:hypothetical protein
MTRFIGINSPHLQTHPPLESSLYESSLPQRGHKGAMPSICPNVLRVDGFFMIFYYNIRGMMNLSPVLLSKVAILSGNSLIFQRVIRMNKAFLI